MNNIPDNDDDILMSLKKPDANLDSKPVSAFARCTVCGGIGHADGACPPKVSAPA